MTNLNKFFIVSALMCVSAAGAYSQQDCNSHLRRATELVSQNNYCEAIKYYRMYGNCDADADVSTEIAMCERRCRIPGEGVNDTAEQPKREDRTGSTSVTTGSRTTSNNQTKTDNRTVNPPKEPRVSTQGFNGFQLHGGVFLPQGDFADSKELLGIFVGIPEIGFGNAALGYNIGFKIYNPISSAKNLSWFLGADAFYNDLQSDYKDYLAEDAEDSGLDYRLPFYLNAPITVGVNYAYPINNAFSIYGELSGGLNFSKYIGIGFKDSYEGFSYSETEKWEMATGFTYGLEAGVLLKEKFTIGIRYIDLGSYKYKGKNKNVTKIEGMDDIVIDTKIGFLKELSISGISLTVGILF